MLAGLAQRERAVEAYFFRTSDQHEIDLVLEFGAERWAVEIKLTAAPRLEDMGRLNRAADLIGARKRVLISRTPRSTAGEREISCSLPWLLRHLGLDRA